MSNGTNKNARENIKAALLELMNKKRFDKISITDIIQLAHVSRTTYYYHYYTQRDILDEIIQNLVQQIEIANKDITVLSRDSLELISKHTLDCVYQNRVTLKTILSSDMADLFKTRYHDFLESYIVKLVSASSINMDSHTSSFEFFFSGHFHMIQDWVLDDCNVPSEEYTQTLSKISALFNPICE